MSKKKTVKKNLIARLLCASQSSWNLSSGQFGRSCLLPPRPFSVLDPNMDLEKGCLCLKMEWEAR